MNGKFRITDGNLLQFDYEKQYTNVLDGWNDVGYEPFSKGYA